jgi:hypothetical protein
MEPTLVIAGMLAIFVLCDAVLLLLLLLLSCSVWFC